MFQVFTAHAQTVIPTSVGPNPVRIGINTGGAYLASARNPNTTDPCTSRYSCVNCTAGRVCAPLAGDQGFREVRQFNCSGSTPYCDYETGTCTATQTRHCAIQGDFICLRDGYFPDQTSCTKFHYCHSSKSYTFTCLQSYYKSKSESCVYSTPCYTFSCAGRNGYKVAYPADPSIYAFCIGNAAYVVDRCLGKDELNATSQRCEPVCRQEGLVEDTEDCLSYYRCTVASRTSSTVTYSMTHHSCPDGEAYSPADFQCLPLEQVLDCCNDPEKCCGCCDSTAVLFPTCAVTIIVSNLVTTDLWRHCSF